VVRVQRRRVILEPDRPCPGVPAWLYGVLAVPAVTTTKVTMSNQLGPSTPYSDTLPVNPASGMG
jgi:hypothetical protein